MDVQALLAPDASSSLGESRARVLDLLRAADPPLGVQEVADQAGLHPNTARFHLDALVDAGLAAREPQPRETPGRPSMAYQATESDGPTGQRHYRLLAEMLTSMIAGVVPQPGERAAEAGREWGRYLTEPPPPYQRLDAGEAIERLTAALAEIGFAPEAVADGSGTGCGCISARSARWPSATRMSYVRCTLALSAGCSSSSGRRSPRTGCSPSPSRASALRNSVLGRRSRPALSTRPGRGRDAYRCDGLSRRRRHSRASGYLDRSVREALTHQALARKQTRWPVPGRGSRNPPNLLPLILHPCHENRVGT